MGTWTSLSGDGLNVKALAMQSCSPDFHPRAPGRERLTPERFLTSTHACTCTQATNLKLSQWLVDASFHSAQSYHSCKFKLSEESSQSDVLPLFFEFYITWYEDSSSERLPSILCVHTLPEVSGRNWTHQRKPLISYDIRVALCFHWASVCIMHLLYANSVTKSQFLNEKKTRRGRGSDRCG